MDNKFIERSGLSKITFSNEFKDWVKQWQKLWYWFDILNILKKTIQKIGMFEVQETYNGIVWAPKIKTSGIF